mgnify:CR=1 FL=1
MVDVTFYGFKVSKVIVTLPREEKGKEELKGEKRRDGDNFGSNFKYLVKAHYEI